MARTLCQPYTVFKFQSCAYQLTSNEECIFTTLKMVESAKEWVFSVCHPVRRPKDWIQTYVTFVPPQCECMD